MTEILRCILSKRGIRLQEEELLSLVECIGRGEESIEFGDPGDSQSITITGEDFTQALNEIAASRDELVEKAVLQSLDKVTPLIVRSLYQNLPAAIAEWYALRNEFEERLYTKWQNALDKLEMLITIAQEAAESYLEDFYAQLNELAEDADPELVRALAVLHCRACRTAREIACLLRGGFPDGAHARWRSLHELAVTAFFFVEHKGDTPRRFFDHAAVESYKSMEKYQQHCKTLGYEPISDDEMKGMRKAHDDAISKYGKPFRGDYGWAAKALNSQRPTFSEIEKSLGMSHWRPFFGLASQNIHAGSHGLHFALGMPEQIPGAILAGASDAGLVDPGHQMAISLTKVTAALLTTYPNIDGLVACKCMFVICDDIETALTRAEN